MQLQRKALRYEGAMLQGYDVSNVNGGLIVPEDAEFVFAKVSQDITFVDKYFTTRRAAARARNIGFGGYHYGDNQVQPDPEASLDFFLSLLGEQDPGEQAALDVEWDYGYGGFVANSPYNQPWVRTWGREFVKTKGYKPKLYTSASGISDFDLDHPEIAEYFDLWYAYWTDNTTSPPPSPSPFANFKLWQYNADQIDKNKFLGTIEDFIKEGTPSGVPELPGIDYESTYWTPIMDLLNQMVADPTHAHADSALHAAVSNAITLHKIAYGVESRD